MAHLLCPYPSMSGFSTVVIWLRTTAISFMGTPDVGDEGQGYISVVTLTAHGVYITLTKTHGLFTEIPYKTHVQGVVAQGDDFLTVLPAKHNTNVSIPTKKSQIAPA